MIKIVITIGLLFSLVNIEDTNNTDSVTSEVYESCSCVVDNEDGTGIEYNWETTGECCKKAGGEALKVDLIAVNGVWQEATGIRQIIEYSEAHEACCKDDDEE